MTVFSLRSMLNGRLVNRGGARSRNTVTMTVAVVD